MATEIQAKRSGRFPGVPVMLCVMLAVSTAGVSARAGDQSDYRLARNFYEAREYRLAIDEFRRFLKKWPRSALAHKAQLFYAESFYQLKDWPAAAREFERFLSKYPKSDKRPEGLLRAMRVRWLLKDHARSLTHAETFLRENRPRLGKPDAPPALPKQTADAEYFAGEACFALNRLKEARTHWTALLRDAPKDSPLLLDACEGLGWTAFKEKQYAEAARWFVRTAADPKHPKAAECRWMVGCSLAEVFRVSGKTEDLEAALAALKKVAARPAGAAYRFKALFLQAELLLEARRFKAALAAHVALAAEGAREPVVPAQLRRAAAVFAAAGRRADALALADLCLKAVAAARESRTTTVEQSRVGKIKARVLSELKREVEALAAAKEALRTAEKIPPGKTAAEKKERAAEIAASLLLVGELSGAKGTLFLSRVLKEYPASTEALYARLLTAQTAGETGRDAKALEEAETLLKETTKRAARGEKIEPLLRANALFAAGEYAFRLNKYARAEPHLRAFLKEAAANDDRRADVTRKLAWVLYKSGQATALVETEKLLRNLLESKKGTPVPAAMRAELLFLQGMCALARKDAVAAISSLDALAKQYPDSPYFDDACYEAARFLYEAGQLKKAQSWLGQLLDTPGLENSPLRSRGLRLRAAVELQLQQPQKALADAEALLKRPELKENLLAARWLKALALLALPKRGAEALTALNELLAEADKSGDQYTPPADPTLREGLRRRGILLWRRGDYAAARRDLRRFLGAAAKAGPFGDGEKRETAVRLAFCLAKLKDLAGAEALLKRLAAEKPTGALAFDVYNQQGRTAYLEKDYKAAAAAFRQALKAADTPGFNPPPNTLAAVWLNLAWAEKLSGRAVKAAEAFGEAARLDPKGKRFAEALLERGRLLTQNGDLESALSAWAELRRRRPKSDEARTALFETAVARTRAGRFAEAATDFEAFLKQYPQSGEVRDAWCGLGECRMHLPKKKSGAVAAFQKAMAEVEKTGRLDDIGVRALLGLAETALSHADAFQAKKYALRIVFSKPNSEYLDEALFFAASACEKLGEPDKAIAYYRKLLKERSKSGRAAEARARLKALGASAPPATPPLNPKE